MKMFIEVSFPVLGYIYIAVLLVSSFCQFTQNFL